MTRDDELFDIQYVKFDADDAQDLINKNVFVSDLLTYLRDAVNIMDIKNPNYYGCLLSAEWRSRESLFKINSDDRTFKYAYYDPYYELKCAFKRGEIIEHNYTGECWIDVDAPEFNDKLEHYRIKQNKLALKWQDIKIGDILRGPIYKDKFDKGNDFYGMVTMIDTDVYSNSHICIGNNWLLNEDICKFRRVNAAGEDIE